MTAAVSKRQQARNERTLQELITTVPGNDRCADCQARNPGWASWNLGVFLCMRCAALHRKLGTHVSKVKSLTMDSWTSEQVENMKKMGNVAANKIYNPRNVKPPIPIDADEADSAMERFIRQKYESKVLEDGKPKPPSRQDPSYVSKSVDDPPPPLPPKPGRKLGFGLRSSFGSSKSSSSGFSIGHQANKQSRTLGLNVGDGNGSFESKLAILRDMGFPDDKRNATILRGFGGDLDKTVESLVRLGEGSGPISTSRSPALSRTTPGKSSDSTDDQLRSTSTNPFDQLDSAPSRPTVGISINRPASQDASDSGTAAGLVRPSYNPFDVPTSQPATASLEQSFQNLQVSQPLFPNITGGYPSQQGQLQASRYQHSMTPPATATLNTGIVSSPSPINGNYNPFFQSVTSTSSQSPNFSPTNPFFGQMAQQNASFQPQLAVANVQQASGAGNNPFYLQHANTLPSFPSTSPFSQQQPQQPQHLYQQPTGNPFFSPQALGMVPTSQPQQLLQPNQANKLDKSSILALYNFSQPPQTIPEQPQQQPLQQSQQNQSHAPPPLNRAQSYPQPSQSSQEQTTNPSATPSVASQSRNPFGVPTSGVSVTTQPASQSLNTAASNNPFPRTHMSQESIDVGRAHSGRHSPDIFASLSARYA
ncbi:hypothetical protein VTO42DRAFT_5747 [Malbranchea cinnamomea]